LVLFRARNNLNRYHIMKDKESLEDILFYSLERSIKSYRQFAQQQLG
jgi:hypothetical protein